MAEEVQTMQDRDAQASKGKGGKYLTFALGSEEYGIGILKVREIIGVMEITAVPHTPPFIKGVINLRGRVIPVVDLRLKFGMPPKEYDHNTCTIVTEVQGQNGPINVGMLVDSVSEVLNITDQEIEPPPSFGTKLDAAYITGMANIAGNVKILLEIDRIIGQADLSTFEES